MRHHSTSLYFLLLAGPLAAQTNDGKPASVEGIVSDSVTGISVPHAHVTLEGSVDDHVRRYGVIAAPDGKFTLAGVAPGSYSVNAEHAGFVPTTQLRGGTRIELKAGDTRTSVEIRMTPTGTIIGRVTDADGEPVENVQVEALASYGNVAAHNTDEQGQFRLGGLAPGKYLVKATAGGNPWSGRPEIRTDGTVETQNAATYYPGVLTKAQAGKVEVRPGNESTGVVIQLVRVPFVRVSGKVAGIPRSAEQPIVMVEQEDLGTGVALKPDGSFETWRLGPGKYKLSGQWNSANGETVRTAPDEIEIAGSNIDNIVLRFVPESNIVGRLQFDDDQAKAFSQGGGPPRTVDLVESGEETRIVVQGPVGVDDTFHFDKIPAGKYRLALSWEDAWIRSMRLGSTTIDGSVIDLSNGSGGAELSLQLSAATGSVAGTVQSDGANSGATIVFLTGADNSGFASRQVVAKPDGTYTIAHLPPGSYRVVAIEESDLTLDANVVEGFEDQMETVDVAGGARVTKNLTRRTPE